MATPGASPLADLQAAYVGVCAAIRDALTNPRISYQVPGGASMDFEQYDAMLTAREAELRKIPGVATSTTPVFTATSVAR